MMVYNLDIHFRVNNESQLKHEWFIKITSPTDNVRIYVYSTRILKTQIR